MRLRNQILGVALTALLAVGSAQAVMITGAFTGIWFDDSAPGQGFVIQVVEVEGIPTVVVYWFTFNEEGEQVWIYGQGDIQDDSASMNLFLVLGGMMMNGIFDPTSVELVPWGSLTISFSDCDNGTVSFTDDMGVEGGFDIIRLTESLGDECTGGPNDNVPPSAGAEHARADLISTGEDADARGRVRYLQNANHTFLKIQVFRLDAGTYEVLVDGESKGSITTNNGGNGKLFFRSPECGGSMWVFLDFDPLGKTYEVVQDGTPYLSGMLEEGDVEDGEGDEEDEGEAAACGA